MNIFLSLSDKNNFDHSNELWIGFSFQTNPVQRAGTENNGWAPTMEGVKQPFNWLTFPHSGRETARLNTPAPSPAEKPTTARDWNMQQSR